jgi:hypothetical protein
MSRLRPVKPVKTMSVSMAGDLFDQIERLASERRRPKSWQILEWVHAGMRSEGIEPADGRDAAPPPADPAPAAPSLPATPAAPASQEAST